MRITTIFLCFAVIGFGQDTEPKPEIQGSVIDAGTNRGLAGAQIVLTAEGAPQPIAQISTDSGGAFHFDAPDFGHYRVEVKMEGYRALLPGLANVPGMFGDSSSHVVLTRGNPKETVQFRLMQPAQIGGRVLDDATLEPLAKIPVIAVSPLFRNGRRGWGPGSRAMTDENGQFLISNVMPGSYLVATLPRSSNAAIQSQFKPEEVTAVDEDFEATFWPSGDSIDSAGMLPVDEGALVTAGDIRVRKAGLYRVHAKVTGDCPEGTQAAVQLEPAEPSPVNPPVNGQVACGQEFLIHGVRPGSYTLSASRGRPAERVQARVGLAVTDRNVDAVLAVGGGVVLEGRVVAAEGAAQPPLDRLAVFVQALDAAAGGSGPYPLDREGRFQVPNAAVGRQRVFFENLTGFYVKEIRYNGQPVSNDTFVVEGGPGARQMEIVIDDKPGTISGAVDDGGKAVARPYIALAAWPPPPDDSVQWVKTMTGGEDGRFRFSGLAPGEYRAVAVAEEAKGDLDQPGVLRRVLADAEKITLDPGGLQDLHLKTTDPRR